MKFEETYIYKYCSLEVGELIISSQLLKFNNPSFFNDPFDCDINLLEFDFSDCCDEVLDDIEKSKVIAFEEFSGIPEHILEKSYNETMSKSFIERNYKEIQIDKIEKSSISCFSLNPSNMTMWSHYADKHKGVCLVFDVGIDCFLEDESLWNRINMNMVRYDDLKPVNYLKSKQEGINNLFFLKSKEWAYEEEWRIFILEENLRYLKFKKTFLKGVIFGANVKDVEISKFQKTISFSGFKHLSLARLRKENLKLGLEDISF